MLLNNHAGRFWRIAGICLFVIFLFSAGYFIQYGQEAIRSGSWKFVINHDDEWYYWADAQGFKNGSSPFYYEERHLPYAPPNITPYFLGSLARIFNVGVLLFFPLWHIGAPFLVWLALFFSLYYFWKYPLQPAAFIALTLCLITLHLKGSYPYTVTRFLRPADFLWIAIPWISLVMNFRTRRLMQLLFLDLIAVVSIWMSPPLAVLGILVIFMEMLWQFFAAKEVRKALWLFSAFVSFLISGMFYSKYLHIVREATQNAWISGRWAQDIYERLSHSYLKDAFSSFLLFSLVVTMVFSVRLLAKRIQPPVKTEGYFLSLSALERLVLYTFFAQPVASVFILAMHNGISFEITTHRYVFFLIQFAALLGWAWESVKLLQCHPGFKKARVFLLILLGTACLAVFVGFHKDFLLLGSLRSLNDFFTDHSSLFFYILPPLLLILLMISRFPTFKSYVIRPSIVISFVTFLGISGFGFFPSQMRECNKKFPFERAYGWLAENAKADDVVLTSSTLYSRMDYLLLYSGLRSYLNEYSSLLSKDAEAAFFREQFVYLLLNGALVETPILDKKSIKEKISFLKLDYILVPRWSPFQDIINNQLGDYLKEVYRDKNSILWEVYGVKSS